LEIPLFNAEFLDKVPKTLPNYKDIEQRLMINETQANDKK